MLSENRPRITTATKHRVVIIGLFTALPYKLMGFLVYKIVNDCRLMLNFDLHTVGESGLAGNHHSVAVVHAR